ncbi:fungal-specific transcription factor domain-containing protein [Mycena floridula]|nr:fungal-specific transcription factor domain-containing protein [Mycena floridula]
MKKTAAQVQEANPDGCDGRTRLVPDAEAKKIKCDSKHPRCGACAAAGTPCNQEDRHRQTLTPRGHAERLELMLAQCEGLLKRHIPGFELDNLEDIVQREGVEVNTTIGSPDANFQFQTQRQQFRQPETVKAFPPGFPPHMLPPPGFPPHMMPYAGPSPYSQIPPPSFTQTNLHPSFYPPQPPIPETPVTDIKGQDPKSNDMSNTQSLAKNFGVSAAIVGDLKLGPGSVDKEDLAVGSNGLTSGRDRAVLQEASTPRDTANWRTVCVRRNPKAAAIAPHASINGAPLDNTSSVDAWLPKDRAMVHTIVNVYFTRLNIHRPVFARKDFEKSLEDLYNERMSTYDPGFLCSVYLVLALGTLSELNHRWVKLDMETSAKGDNGGSMSKKLLPPDWPDHDEFFDRALLVKPDLLVTISSLQALILLHWYLYTERQGRTLWRLVGSLVRLSIELGLHHDPTTQTNTVTGASVFTEDECQLRIRLWGIVLVHDRGTSILLGRPLAISPSDANTPRPSRPKSGRSEFSEHFELSHPVAEIQADIINSLYSPSRQSGDTIMRNATRIIKSMLEFRTGLPEKYRDYFGGTDDWTLEQKSKLVQDITEDEGLTLLKIGISRILLLRALFSLKELSYTERRKALVDAIVTSHNTIIVHSQLIRFPDIAFFTSPIPLHIAAMVILYGHMSKCDRLPKHTALEDVWLALDMLPRFRWRWERKDANGSHPLIAKLAERVMDTNLHTVSPTTHPVLLSEPEWDDVMSPQQTPTTAYAHSPVVYGPRMDPTVQTNGKIMDKNMLEVPANLFYPFYPENNINGSGQGPHQDYSALMAAAAAQPSQDTYMSEERDANSVPLWVQSGNGNRSYAIPPQS